MDEFIQAYLNALVEDDGMRGNLTDAECVLFVRAMSHELRSRFQIAMVETKAKLRTLNQICKPGDGWLERKTVVDMMLGVARESV